MPTPEHHPRGATMEQDMEKRKGLTIGKTRSLLYALSRLLGDVNAVKRGKVGKRLMRRAAGKVTGRALGKWFR